MNKFIVIEGNDGCGKSTQSALLQNECRLRGIPYWFNHLPRYDLGFSGRMIAEYLRGEYGDLKTLHPKLVSLLFALNRQQQLHLFNTRLEQSWVLMDRYVYSNLAYQSAKFEDELERKEFRSWLLALEFDEFNLPVPDMLIYLDVPLDFFKSQLQKRLNTDRDYLKGSKDIHEIDFDFQQAVYREYQELEQALCSFASAYQPKSFVHIYCADGLGNMRPVLDIFKDIKDVVFKDVP